MMKIEKCGILLGSFALLASSGCVEPMGSDEQGFSRFLLPPDAEVPDVEDDPALLEVLEAHDGVDGRYIPRFQAWAEGREVHYWNLGEAPRAAIPVWAFLGDPTAFPFDFVQNALYAAAPGDPEYSPFWSVYMSVATPQWDGRLITNVPAMRDAVHLGMFSEPQLFRLNADFGCPAPDPLDCPAVYVNCPVVAKDTELEIGIDSVSGDPITVAPPMRVYIDGVEYSRYTFGGWAFGIMAMPENQVPVANVYSLRRANESVSMSEPDRGEDLNGDGDTRDTNVIFPVPRCVYGEREDPKDPTSPETIDQENGSLCLRTHPTYTDLWRVVKVVVPADTQPGDYTRESDLFERQGDILVAKEGVVLDFEITDTLLNCPVQPVDGMPPG